MFKNSYLLYNKVRPDRTDLLKMPSENALMRDPDNLKDGTDGHQDMHEVAELFFVLG